MQFDRAGNLSEAFEKYRSAAEILLDGYKKEKVGVFKDHMKEWALKYMERGEEIKKQLDSSRGSAKPAERKETVVQEPEPLTEEKLDAAQAKMEAELEKLV